jgi:hypothetical protein
MPVNAIATANPPACQPGSVPSSQQRSLRSFRSFQSALKSPSCLRCQQVQRREGSALSSGKCVHSFRSFHSLITPSFSLFILSLVPIGLCEVSEPIRRLATSPASLLAIRSPCPSRVALLDNLVRALRFCTLFVLVLIPIVLCGVSEEIGYFATLPAPLLAIRSLCPLRVAPLVALICALRLFFTLFPIFILALVSIVSVKKLGILRPRQPHSFQTVCSVRFRRTVRHSRMFFSLFSLPSQLMFLSLAQPPRQTWPNNEVALGALGNRALTLRTRTPHELASCQSTNTLSDTTAPRQPWHLLNAVLRHPRSLQTYPHSAPQSVLEHAMNWRVFLLVRQTCPPLVRWLAHTVTMMWPTHSSHPATMTDVPPALVYYPGSHPPQRR